MARGAAVAGVSAPGSWIEGTGREAAIALTTRARLARNCAGVRFLPEAEPAERDRVVTLVREWTCGSENRKGLSPVTLAGTTKAFRGKLVSGLIIGPVLPKTPPEVVAISPDCSFAVLVNEEDHLRIQVTGGGLCARWAAAEAREIEESLASHVEFARRQRFGYLTASISNCGTGLRVSVMLHLAALRIEEKIPAITESAHKLNVAVRGAFGEGSLPLGDLFQVSNAGARKSDTAEIASRVESVAEYLIREETSARGRLKLQESEAVERNARRALSELRRGSALSRTRGDVIEAMRLWSAVRLGLEMDLAAQASRRETNEILAQMLIQAGPGS